MTTESKALLIDRYLSEVLNAGDFSRADELLAPDLAFFGPSTRQGLDREGFEKFIKETRAAFSNKHFAELDRIVEGDRIALRFRMTGTQDGWFNGLPATGSSIDVEGCDVIRLQEDRIVEIRTYFDLMATVQRLLMPIPTKIIGGLIGGFLPR